MLTLRLPFPPTTNNLFFNLPGRRGGRAPSKGYKAWKERAAVAIRQQAPVPVPGPVMLSIVLGRPDRRRRDLSNYLKALEDALVQHGLIDDDSMVQTLSVSWHNAPGAVLRVWPWTAEREAIRALPAEGEAA